MVELAGRVVLQSRSVRAARPSRGGVELFDAEGARVVAVPGVGAPKADPAALASELERFVLGAEAVATPLGAEMVEGALVVGYAATGTETLDQAIARGSTPSGRVADIADGVAQALGFLHDRGLAHGFLRPDLVSADVGRIALGGFGLDRLIVGCAGHAALVAALGQPYAAPELAAATAREGRPSADVRALAVMIVELLAGRALGEAEAPREVLGTLGVAEPARTLLAAALAPEPSRRPMDVVRFATDVGDCLRAAPPAAVPPRAPRAQPPPPEPPPPEPPPPAPPPQAQPEPPPQAQPEPPPPEPPPAQPPQAQPEPQPPPPAPPPQAQPQPPPPAPPAQPPPFFPPSAPPPAESRSVWPILSIIAGVLLLLTGVAALFGYAWMRPSSPAVVVVDAGAPPVATLAPDAAVAPPPPPEEEADAGVDGDEPDAAGGVSSDDGGAPAFEPVDAGAPFVAKVSADDRAALIPVERAQPVLGRSDALVTLVVFGDLECPHTQREIADLERLRKAFGADLRIAWRHRPLRDHSHARRAALVAQSVYAERGGAVFWRLLQTLASAADEPTQANLERWVNSSGADGSRVASWAHSARAAKVVDDDVELAGLFDVRSTPTLFVNGRRLEGYQPYRALEDVVRKELAAARALLSTGIGRSDVYAARVRKNLVDLGTDVPDRTCPTLSDAPVRGKADALVTIVEFSDFQCPFCRRLQPALEVVLARHGGDVRLAWKNFPLAFHHQARPAAAFALQAQAVGGDARFWRAHDLLFASQRDLSEPALARIAGELGLDAATTLGAVRRGKFDARIDADIREGKRVGVTGTPVLFINGRMLPGARPAAQLDAVVKDEIDWARKLVAQGTPRSRVYETLCGGR